MGAYKRCDQYGTDMSLRRAELKSEMTDESYDRIMLRTENEGDIQNALHAINHYGIWHHQHLVSALSYSNQAWYYFRYKPHDVLTPIVGAPFAGLRQIRKLYT
jgi:hypothetical protein